MSMEIRELKEDEIELWNRIVEESPDGTIFHSMKWLKIVEKHTGYKLISLIGFKGSTPIGIFPIFYKRRKILNVVFSSPPGSFIPYLGPILVDYANLKQHKKESTFTKFQELVDNYLLRKLKSNYTFISLHPNIKDSRPFIWTNYEVKPNYDYIIDLSLGIDTLFNS